MAEYNLQYPPPVDYHPPAGPVYPPARAGEPGPSFVPGCLPGAAGEPKLTFYNFLRQEGKEDAWIELSLGPLLTKAGFADQEINAYFAKHKLPGERNESVSYGYFDSSPQAGTQEDLPPVDFAREGRLARAQEERLAPETPVAPRPEHQPFPASGEQTFLESGERAVREIPMDTLRRYGLFAGEDASYSDVLAHGLENSVSGLASRGKLPDSLTQREADSLPFIKRGLFVLGTVVGDMPYYLAGGAMGWAASGGNPVAAMAGGFGLTARYRAKYMDQIQNGTPQDFFDGLQREGIYLYEGVKAGAVGALTGATGGAVGGIISRAGGGFWAGLAGTTLAETGALTAGSGAMRVEIPHYQEFLDNLFVISAIKGVLATGGARGQQAVNRANQDLTVKLRATYAATGATPREVMRLAETDPTVLSDLLHTSKMVPELLVTEVIENVRSGELPLEEITPFQDRPQAQAVLAEALARGAEIDVDFGKLRPDYKDALNEIRAEEGVPPFVDDNLLIPGGVVKKLYEKRIVTGRMSADEVAEMLINVFHKDADFASPTYYPHIQALGKFREHMVELGFIAPHSKTGRPAVKSIYLKEISRLEKSLEKK